MKTTHSSLFDVCIIGSGWAGLLACKYALANNLSVIVLEKRDSLGGVWNFTPDPEVITVMSSTVTSSSATVTEASDFYMDPKLGQFLHNKDVHNYLKAYAQHFALLPHIQFDTAVQNTVKAEHWQINCLSNGADSVVQAKHLIVCSGINGEKKPLPEDIAAFTGPVDHLAHIKSIEPDDYANEDVLVYGGGESASDVVEALAKTGAKISWSIPAGQHFFRKVAYSSHNAPGEYAFDGSALDEASSRFVQRVAPYVQSKPGMKWLCTLGSTGSVFGFEGHGIEAWRKNVPFMHAMVNKNGHAVEFVHSGRATAKGKIRHCSGKAVTFDDGSQHTYSRIILCTGYRPAFPFLPETFATKAMSRRYKMIFDTQDPSLLFLGYVRPTVGSIPLMMEMQCRYAFKVLAGQCQLPDKAQMDAAALKDVGFWQDYFYQRRRADTLVEPFIYGHDLAKLAGAMPHYGKLFLRSPLAFFKSYFSPMSSAHFELNDENTRDKALQQIWSRQRKRWFVLPWVYLLARILQVDPIIDWFAARRHKKTQAAESTGRLWFGRRKSL